MDWQRIAPYALRYTVVGGGLTVAVLYAAAWLANVPFVPVALVAGLGSLLLFALLAGTSDTGLESAAAGAEAGFGGVNPSSLQPDSLPIPGRELLVLYLLGVAAWGIAARS